MRQKVRKPLKSLMLSLMALVTATATLVSASSYSIRIEHIWEDNNDAAGKRPTDITETVIQTTNKQGEDEDGNTVIDKTDNLGYLPGDPSSDGTLPSESGSVELPDGSTETKDSVKDDGTNTTNRNEGYTAGAGAAENVVKPDFDSEPLEPLGKPIKETYVSSDPEETEREQARLDAEYAEKLAAWESTEEYQQYKKDKEVWDNYQNACDEALEKYLQENAEILKDKTDEEKAEISAKFRDKFKEGFDAASNNTGSITDKQREDNIQNIRDQLKDVDTAEDKKQLAEDISKTVDELLKGTETENLWSVEGEVDEKDDNGNPLTYDAIMTEETKKALEDAGYTSTKLKVTVTLVKGDDGFSRVYVSVDGGTNWAPADPATKAWDETNGTTYNPAEDYVDETVITFLHTLPDPDPKDPKDPKDPDPKPDPKPEEELEEPPVPQADIEEPEPEPEPEEEMEEPEVPLTEIPATGDSSGLWMLTAMISGAAFLALLKKRDESEEATEA